MKFHLTKKGFKSRNTANDSDYNLNTHETGFLNEDIERKVLLILKILHESAEPVGARVIARKWPSRREAQRADGALPSQTHGRAGTDAPGGTPRRTDRHRSKGLHEISDARVQDKIGLSIARIDVSFLQDHLRY